jgi:RimJ/RimL family protein N-acetyltransferase
MKSGRIVRSFSAKDGRRVILRTPRWEDLDDLLGLINSLVDEKADIFRAEKTSREEEINWLSGLLARLEKDEVFFLVAEVDGKVVASSHLNRRSGYEKHVGVLGIVIKNGFREIGIGTEIMKTLIEEADKMGLEVLTLSVFASNKRAIHVYEKVDFSETGRIPRKHFRDGEYIDEVIMTKLLE